VCGGEMNLVRNFSKNGHILDIGPWWEANVVQAFFIARWPCPVQTLKEVGEKTSFAVQSS